MFFRKRIARRLEVPELPTVDHSLASAAIDRAVADHRAAQSQAAEAQQVVTELKRVNVRNGFAPAIRKSFDRTLGEAT